MPTQTAMKLARQILLPTPPTVPTFVSSGLELDIQKLYRVALQDRWGLALVTLGWLQLGLFSICQILYGSGDRAEAHFLPLWALDAVGSVAILHTMLVRGRGPLPSLFRLVARVWITGLILAFSSAVLNSVVGFQTDWFKAVWATLSTFGFAMMAWIFHLKFLIPAVQMSMTAMLMARYPTYAYGIYALSWWLALHAVGLSLERRRTLYLASFREEPATAPTIKVYY